MYIYSCNTCSEKTFNLRWSIFRYTQATFVLNSHQLLIRAISKASKKQVDVHELYNYKPSVMAKLPQHELKFRKLREEIFFLPASNRRELCI